MQQNLYCKTGIQGTLQGTITELIVGFTKKIVSGIGSVVVRLSAG